MMYLWGDRVRDDTKFIGNPWLERDYQVREPPSPFISRIIFAWILFLANKAIIITIILILIAIGLLIRSYLKNSN